MDVTTEETDASGNPIQLADRGSRAVIGGSSSDWLGVGAGGIAYVGVFGYNYDQPAFVFPAQLGGGDPQYVWEAISHEIGHTLGLSVSAGPRSFRCRAGASWEPFLGNCGG